MIKKSIVHMCSFDKENENQNLFPYLDKDIKYITATLSYYDYNKHDIGTRIEKMHHLREKITELSFSNSVIGINENIIYSFKRYFSNITTLIFENSQICCDISLFANETENLKKISIRSCCYHENILDFGNLNRSINLEELHLFDCDIQEILNIQRLSDLSTLSIGYVEIVNYNFISHLKNLVTLKIIHTCITNIDFVTQFKNLENLTIGYNKINDYRFLKKLNNLKSLTLEYNNNNCQNYPKLENYNYIKMSKRIFISCDGIKNRKINIEGDNVFLMIDLCATRSIKKCNVASIKLVVDDKKILFKDLSCFTKKINNISNNKNIMLYSTANKNNYVRYLSLMLSRTN